MLKYANYLSGFENAQLSRLRCNHCGADAYSTNGKDAICSFCEEYSSISDAGFYGGADAEATFTHMQYLLKNGSWSTAEIEKLLANSSDPKLFYTSAIFLSAYSDLAYYSTNYASAELTGRNSENIRAGIEFASKSKECFYKAIALINADIKSSDAQASEELLYTKVLSETRLHRLADAAGTLSQLRVLDIQGPLTEYAEMVYSIEAGTDEADALLETMLARNYTNAFYYLARHLAKQGLLDDAESVISRLNKKSYVPMAETLLRKIEAAQEESE